jgi:Tfp pilus assembly protein PilN
MRAVNLLPRQHVERKQKRKRESSNPVVPVAGIGGAIVVLALAGGFLLANRSVDRQRQALATAKSVLAATPAKTLSAQTQAFRSTILSQREERSLALAAALGKRVSWDRLLRHVALVLPNDVWLTSLTGSVPLQSTVQPGTTSTTAPGPLPAMPTALTITGSTYSQDGVARLLSRLAVIPDLKNVQLQSSATGQIANQNVINFTIVSDIRQGGGAS